MRVFGIDCGTEYTGYGIVETSGRNELRYVACGAVKLNKRFNSADRLKQVHEELEAQIAAHLPDVLAIEEVFYSVNPKSALKLGQVRGVAMLAGARAGLPIAEYSPLAIKSAVVGYGRADKQQVQYMVTKLLALSQPPEPFDASDALAIAICHLHTSATLLRQSAGAHV
ncbi:MAG: crossover junction endodeoxyribonuclease RuvC [Acidobacteriales bacterium]|nr:crossover junction endodeoxyribonuclease RuvC [Terriglobales bacterium]